MSEHVHDLPPPVEDAADQPCSGCGRWFTVAREYCYECGRSGDLEWRRTTAPRLGPHQADGEFWRHAPPPMPLFPMARVRRGGLLFTTEPPPYSWLDRDADIKADFAYAADRHEQQTLGDALTVSGGWCAPYETLYDI